MTTLHRSWPVARRPHRCDRCSDLIEPGDRYYRWKGTSDLWDGVMTAKECESCATTFNREQQEVDDAQS